MEPPIRKKSSLCRFYLRGLCIHQMEECWFSHGIQDLDYQKWNQGQHVEFDHLEQNVFNQKGAVKGPRNYVNLYEFQQEKTYTLGEINTIRPVRVEVRTEMHKKLFIDFMRLLEKYYPGANFTESILMREYFRVGFNKLMTRIKFSHLTDQLCQGDNPPYYMKSIVMPPLIKQAQNFIFPRAPESEILDCYKEQLKRIATDKDVDESTLKKALFQMTYPNFKIPPLVQVLKAKRMSFAEFLNEVSKSESTLNKQVLKTEAITLEEITAKASELLDNSVQLLSWGELYKLLTKELKINNANIINQCKPHLVLNNYYFLHFPMLQYIVKQQKAFQFGMQAQSTCQCQLKEAHDLKEYEKIFKQNKKEIKDGQSIDINDWSSLLSCAQHLLQSTAIAVDVQGTLRKGGTVEMVQINNGTNTFLLDFYSLFTNNDPKTVDLAKKILRNIFANETILKVFHDCRHDSLVIHEILGTCIVNIFDTSAVETLKDQLHRYKQANNEGLAKIAIADNNYVRTWGLNDVLKRHNASHGVNIHKDRFHSMWSKGQEKFFLKRPMDHDYRDYCIFDVLDLLEVQGSMAEEMSKWQLEMGKWVSSYYVAFGFEHSLLNQ